MAQEIQAGQIYRFRRNGKHFDTDVLIVNVKGNLMGLIISADLEGCLTPLHRVKPSRFVRMATEQELAKYTSWAAQ